ncbi:hypothetical protein [Paraburkholderia unamae]|nr:hypothetical protein [Paraburkholderia unamae]
MAFAAIMAHDPVRPDALIRTTGKGEIAGAVEIAGSIEITAVK